MSAPTTSSRAPSVNWASGAIAGVGAGIIATFVQLALWLASSAPLAAMFARDTRMAAAIAMGSSVLPPPLTLAWDIVTAATMVHFALSAIYGLLLAPLLARLRMRAAIVAGAGFGLIVYCVNMYGFTSIFPWFAASRDWITATAHAAFGLALAYLYKARTLA
ncbi:DUF543 domain-containing protein [Noviherbaspirillum cavernae]|uniref:DUF543 domain-containing protein n=2 Tax=Noviherbaspirillum cavernae TaxID=2320862 RepID=A0A418X6F4_9BURK|nr:DUF543 domain-containing protein [Noviherbaspirillum cavernae]